MDIKIRKAGATTILDLKGSLMVGESEGKFRQKIKELLAEGSWQIAINLAGVSDMDSWGLGSLVRHCSEVRRAGGRCIFFAPSARILHLLRIAHVDSVLDIAADEAAALSRE
ncbi:MAG TPA: STAS domain-containing protein [Candidatus Acidoferrales bacterium]|nr:STAS domain-containing protein [Candidatus Acidoferrales bacterium]